MKQDKRPVMSKQTKKKTYLNEGLNRETLIKKRAYTADNSNYNDEADEILSQQRA